MAVPDTPSEWKANFAFFHQAGSVQVVSNRHRLMAQPVPLGGRFYVSLPPGIYTLTGSAGSGQARCGSTKVTVTASKTIATEVVCAVNTAVG